MKKLAGAALGTLLIASMVLGTTGLFGSENAPSDLVQAKEAPFSGIAAAAPAASAEAAPAEAAPEESASSEYSAYLFVHFIDTEENPDKEQIYFSVSTDGTDWTTLNDKKPVLKSDVGEKGVRDPHIIRTPDNKFRIVATDLSIANRTGDKWGTAQTGGSRNIVIWKSDTIDGWTGGGTAYPIGTEDSLDVWAPESIWDVDKEQYMVTWASIVGDRATKTCYDWHYRIYRSYTTDFENFTEPEVYMEREGNIIDTTFYYNEANEMYYRFTKDEHNKWVFMEEGAHLDGEFEMVATYSLDGKHYTETTGVEGPTVYKSNTEDKWFLLLDNWTYKPYETDDITKGIFTKAGEFTFNGLPGEESSPRFRHGSVIPITQEEYDALLKAYPVPELEEPEPDKTTGELIYELGFENNAPKALKGSYAATVNGNITYAEGRNGGQAAVVNGNGNFISIDSAALADHENLTISFIVKQNNAEDKSWIFYAAPNDNAQNYNSEVYIGALFKDGGTIACERYLTGRGSAPDSYQTGVASGEWIYLTIVYGKSTTKVFINGQLKADEHNRSTTETTASLLDILGKTPTIYLGKANWSSGEYANMTLDRFRVYDYAMPDEEVAQLYADDTAA